ncbi:hypothetical protein KHQ89_03295 [Mycoplasmatota bacterium]|nr:hypothetical protein KHQ89_03295 [Mycoplasmatota bacterium]
MKNLKIVNLILMHVLGIYLIASSIILFHQDTIFTHMLTIVNGIVFIVFAWIKIKTQLIYLLLTTFLFANFVLTLSNELGYIDSLFMLILIFSISINIKINSKTAQS